MSRYWNVTSSHERKKAMAEKDEKRSWVMVNRAPLLTLWAAVVAEVLGFEHDEALTLGRAVEGLNAYSKVFRERTRKYITCIDEKR